MRTLVDVAIVTLRKNIPIITKGIITSIATVDMIISTGNMTIIMRNIITNPAAAGMITPTENRTIITKDIITNPAAADMTILMRNIPMEHMLMLRDTQMTVRASFVILMQNTAIYAVKAWQTALVKCRMTVWKKEYIYWKIWDALTALLKWRQRSRNCPA